LSVIFALRENYLTAAWLIILAAIFDALDGMLARFTKTSSDFGVEFDSLADVVSFGLAPSVLVYLIYFHHFGDLGVVISFMPLLFGGIRLARFNVQFSGYEKESYVGLPIPMQAIILSSFILFNYDLWDDLKFSFALTPLVLFLCLLMVSTIEYDTLPKFSLRNTRKNFIKLLVFVSSSILIALFPRKALFPLTFIFVWVGIARWLYHLLRHGEAVDMTLSDR